MREEPRYEIVVDGMFILKGTYSEIIENPHVTPEFRATLELVFKDWHSHANDTRWFTCGYKVYRQGKQIANPRIQFIKL